MFWKKKKSESASGFTKTSKSGFSSSESDELDESTTLWEKLTQLGVPHNAINWFSDFEAIDFESKAPEALKKVHADFLSSIEGVLDAVADNSDSEEMRELVSRVKILAASYNPQIMPDMEINIRQLSAVDIRDSKLGKKLLAALDKQEINYFDTSASGIPEEADGIFMRWDNTNEGHLNLQYLRTYEDEAGKEIAYWHTYVLASNRPIDYRYIPHSKGGDPFADIGDRLSSPEGQYNLKWALPALLKDVAFLAETPFPSTAGLMTFTRDLAFEGVPQKSRPRPAFAILPDEMFAYTHDIDGWEIAPLKPPHTAVFGWVLTEDSLSNLDKIIPVVSSGCTFALNLFESGETNHVGLFNGLDWHSYLRQPSVLSATKPEEYGQRYTSEWLTLAEYSRRNAYVMENYNDVYNAPSSQDRRDGFEDLLQNGADRFVLHAANSMVFGEYLDSVISSDDELEEALEILSMAFSLDVDNDFGECQATNALSNSGVLYYQAGKLDLAEQQLQQALSRAGGEPEGGSEDEANYVLSLVYEELGKSDEAEEYRELGSDYNSAPRLRRPGSKTTKTSSAKPGGKFCTSCGQAFLKPEQKFCSGCGAKR